MISVASALIATLLAGAAPAPPAAPDAALARQAHALLQTRCLSCHGADRKGGLDLRLRAGALQGGGRGAALRPGSAEGSLLHRMVSGGAKPAMPPGAPLQPGEIELLRRWIAAGAPWPQATSRKPQAAGGHWAFSRPVRPSIPAPRAPSLGGWVRNPVDAFIAARLEREGLTPAPAADRRTLIRRVSLDLAGLPPTPEELAAFLADPSPNAYERVVDRLLASPQYGERWAQHWLDVVRFAETNGFELDGDRPHAWRYRDWVVRALNEDKPYDQFIREQIAGDELAPESFEARVATGFLRAGPQHVVGGNQDAAVNRQEWLTEAVGGVGNAVLGLTIGCARCHDHKFDPLPQADFYRLQAFFAAADNQDFRRVVPEEQKAYDAAVLAHKAKLKPIQDQIAVIERPYRELLRGAKLARLERKYAQALAIDAGRRTPEQQRLAGEALVLLKIDWDELVAALGPADRDRRAALRAQMHALDLDAPPPLPLAPGVADVLSPMPASHVLIRGEAHVLGAGVEPGYPAALAAVGEAPGAGMNGPGRRLTLAHWLTAPDHPLTARVIVNRLWQHHFGRGIVGTPNDFGKNGQAPTHPELLDWLASVFTQPQSVSRTLTASPSRRPSAAPEGLGWSLKRLHRLMVTSAAYRQSTIRPPTGLPGQARARKAELKDPENRLLWRMNPQRLDAEALRDAVLRTAGTLNLQAGGPSVRVPLEPEVYATIFTEAEPDNLWPVAPDPRQHARRSLYLLRKRNVRLPMLAVFDQPDAMSSCAARGRSVHALQALTLMNSDFMIAQSRALAVRAGFSGAGDERRRIDHLYELALARPANAAEVAATQRFLREQTALIRGRIARGEPVARLQGVPAGTDPAEAAAWADLSLAVLNLNEFAYRN